jgi:hypothetical protein
MLDDERLFQRLSGDEEFLLRVSPWLLFSVFLRQVRRDLEGESFTVERRQKHKVFLFDTDQVIELLQQSELRDYLAALLASFTRIESLTVRVRVRQGIWRRYRTNELDIAGLIRAAEGLEEGQRFEPYKRIADVCLFLTGVFPEFIEAQYRYPLSRQRRPARRGWTRASLEDYESQGQAFYRLAAEHRRAAAQGLDGVLHTLSDNFVLAEKSLALLAKRYLPFVRHALFNL